MRSRALGAWVREIAAHTKPEVIRWCDGSEAEARAVEAKMVDEGTLFPLNRQTYPGCFLHRSHPTDVARTEHLTFICSPRVDDAGPTNQWMSPVDAHARIWPLFYGCMAGRTMYVVPYLMGPYGSPYSRVGVELTDSPYVAASLRIMTHMGTWCNASRAR